MCHGDSLKRIPALLALLSIPLLAESSWQKLGGYTFDAGLASAATGPVAAVWFSSDGSKLFARTQDGAVWESSDLESWSRSSAPATRPREFSPDVHGPESGARSISAAGGSVYSLGSNLLRSDDNGKTWTNLTAFNGRSVIGAGQNDIAISPRDSQTIVAANAWGVWASHDGGLSWAGLNDNLPNLKLDGIISASSGVKASLAGVGAMELDPGGVTWKPVGPPPTDLAVLSKLLNTIITAAATNGDTVYAGSTDGHLWVSRDHMVTWVMSLGQAGGPIERIFVDASNPVIAFAAASGRSRSLLRTINAGQFWDDITGSLTENPAHAVVADRSSGTIYAATDRGVFMARADLNALGPVPLWTAISGLPDQPARDLKLSVTRLYAAIDGYGIYVRSTPQQTATMRLVNAADLSDRAAAPGSLYSVVGRRVQAATAGSLTVPVLASTNDESQIQIPFEATGSQLSLTLDQTVTALTLKPVSPALFLDKEGSPMLIDAESGLMLESRATLRPQARIQILATGLGRTTPSWPTAIPAPVENSPVVAVSVQAFLNGRPIEVSKATLAPGYVGLYLVELTLPVIVDAGAAELFLSAGGEESNRVRIYLAGVSGT